MVDLNKEIIFKDGILFDENEKDLTPSLSRFVDRVCELGTDFGLTLVRFEIDDEMIHIDWRGKKGDVLRFYTCYSKTMTTESLEKRKITQKIILNK